MREEPGRGRTGGTMCPRKSVPFLCSAMAIILASAWGCRNADSPATVFESPALLRAPGQPYVRSPEETQFIAEQRAAIERGQAVDASNTIMRTRLHQAAEEGYLDAAAFLVAKGANIDARDNCGATPLDRAAFRRQFHVVTLLVEKGANVRTVADMGSAPLHYAAQGGSVSVIEHLINHGAHVDAKDRFGETPLHDASMMGQVDAVECLLRRGAKIEERSHTAQTALHFAALNGKPEVVKVLIEAGADIDSVAHMGTPFTRALYSSRMTPMTPGKIECAKILVLAGARLNARENERARNSALHYACETGDTAFVEWLVEHGADPNAKNCWGQTPVEWTPPECLEAMAKAIARAQQRLRMVSVRPSAPGRE